MLLRKPIPWLLIGLCSYFCASLISMASLNFGLLSLGLCTCMHYWGQRRMPKQSPAFSWLWKNHPQVLRYIQVSCLLTGACFLSALAFYGLPLQFGQQSIGLDWGAFLGKTACLFLPLYTGFILIKLKPQERLVALKCWLGFAFFMSLIGLVQFFTGFPRPQPLHLEGLFHVTLWFGHHLSVSSILIFPFFAALSLACGLSKHPWFKDKSYSEDLAPFACWQLFVMVFFLGLALILTWSRMLWVALPFGISCIMIHFFKRKIFWIALVVEFFAFVSFTLLPGIRTRFFSLLWFGERLQLWILHLQFFKQRPWFGVGFRRGHPLTTAYFEHQFPRSWETFFTGHSHNNFISVLSETGLVGAAAWLAWNGFVFFWSYQLTQKKAGVSSFLAWGIFCSWVVFHLNGITQLNFWDSKVTHQLLISLGWLVCIQTLDQKNFSGKQA